MTVNQFIAKAIGAAFIAWVNNAREKMAAKSRTEVMDEAELTALLAEVFKKTRATYITDLGPAVVSAFIAGNIESGFGVNRKSVEVLAYNYAASIVDYANKMTSLSAAEAYRGIINRKKSPKEAFNFMVNSLGVDRRAVRSLLAMFDSKDEVENKSLSSMRPNKKKQRMDNYVAAAIELRAKRMGEEESFGAKETSKALVWNLAKVQGVANGQRKRWVTARDELVCPNCGPMDGQTVELDEKFVLPNKVEVWAPSLHPHCRCVAVIVVRVKGDRKKNSLFDRARDLIGKSDNDWETQPRSNDGRFGNRPRGMSFRDHAAPTQAPQPQRMTATKLKERPRGITYQDIDWSAVEQQLKTVPEVKVKTKPKDQDVAQAMPKPKPVSEMTLEEYVRHIQTKPDEPVSITKGITVISRIQGIKPVAVVDLKTIEKIAYVEVIPKINPVDLATTSTATKVVTEPVKVVDLKTTVANAAQAVGVVTDVDTDVKLDEDNKIYAFGYIGDGEMTVNGSTLASSSATDVSRSVRYFMESEIMKYVEDIPSDHTYTIRTSDGDRVKVTGADVRDAAISYANSVADQKINDKFNEVDLDNGVSTYHTDDEILDAWERASKLPASINDFARHFDFKSAINPNDYGFVNLAPMVGSDERFAVTHGEHTDGIHIVTDREFDITIDLNSGNAIPDDPEVDADFDEFVSDTNPFDDSTWDD